MKEKRVDILLAEAGMHHIGMIGLAGAFLTELIRDEPRGVVEWVSAVGSVFLYAIVRNRVSKAKAIAKKSKKTQS